MPRVAIPLSLLLSLLACNTGPKPAAVVEDTPTEPIHEGPGKRPAPPTPPPAHFGDPISAPEVALADIAKDPKAFADRPFTTTGTVTAVCQEMGCWMEIKDAANGAHMRMHGHSFFVPKTASGKKARVQATLVAPGAAKACADEACAPKDMALLQLDATGVELD